MPTKHATLTDTTPVDIIALAEHQKPEIKFLRVYNAGSSNVVVTLQQVSPGGTVTKTVDEIPISAGQVEVISAEDVIYDLDRGHKLQGKLDASGDVRITITYRVK